MVDSTPLYVPLGIALAIMVIGYSSSYILMREGILYTGVVQGLIKE